MYCMKKFFMAICKIIADYRVDFAAGMGLR